MPVRQEYRKKQPDKKSCLGQGLKRFEKKFKDGVTGKKYRVVLEQLAGLGLKIFLFSVFDANGMPVVSSHKVASILELQDKLASLHLDLNLNIPAILKLFR